KFAHCGGGAIGEVRRRGGGGLCRGPICRLPGQWLKALMDLLALDTDLLGNAINHEALLERVKRPALRPATDKAEKILYGAQASGTGMRFSVLTLKRLPLEF